MDPIELVVDLLKDGVNAPVFTEMPTDRPTACVQVSQGGDRSTELLLQPRINLLVWGESDVAARTLAVACVDCLRDAALDHELLSSAQLESMSRDEWTRTGHARYFVELDLVINIE